jgi:transposase
MGGPSAYSPEVRGRAVQMVLEQAGEQATRWAAICSVASKLGCSSETLREWVRRVEVDSGWRAGVTSEERERPRRLEQENLELRRAIEILKALPGIRARASRERATLRDSPGAVRWVARRDPLENLTRVEFLVQLPSAAGAR